MTEVSLKVQGLERIGAGFSLFCRGMIDAARGLYWILSGILMLVAGVISVLWSWIRLPTINWRPDWADASSLWKWIRIPRIRFPPIRFPRVRLTKAAIKRGWRGFIGVLMVGAIAAAISIGIDYVIREVRPDIGGIVYPLALFTGLAVVVLVTVVAIRLAAELLMPVGRFLTRQGAGALSAIVVVILATSAGALLVAVLQPPFIIALMSCLALVAGLAGFAVVSLGPSAFSIFRFGGQGGATAAADGGVIHTSPSPGTNQRPQPLLAQPRPAAGIGVERVAPGVIEVASSSASDVPAHSRQTRFATAKWRRLRSWPVFRQRWITVALFVVLALLLAWFGGELLLRVFSGASQPAAPSVKPATPPAVSPVRTPTTTVGPQIIQLLADGVPADVSWRLGYRNRTARLDDGGLVRELTLPENACRAGALVVFGAASSDGAAARNEALARGRATWLGDWTRTQLSQCPNQAPVVIAVSLGQARPGMPLPAQRAVRLLAIRAEDMRNPAFTSDATMLRDMARASFKGLDAFTRFDACIVTAHKDDEPSQGWLRPCATPPQ